MRKALDKIGSLYTTSPVFQDLLETGINTGMIAAGQAIGTDMTAEEIALSAGLGAGAAMIGRPIGGRAGQAIGGAIDRAHPGANKFAQEVLQDAKDMPGLGKVFAAKMAPYKDLGGMSQYGQLIGRGYGDNIAQYGVGIGSAMLLSGDGNQQTSGTIDLQ